MIPEHGDKTKHGKHYPQRKKIITFRDRQNNLNERLTNMENKTLLAIVLTVTVILLFSIWMVAVSLIVFTHH